MTRLEFLHNLAKHLERSCAELCESPDYRDGLARWKELHVLNRQIQVELDFLENVLKMQYHEQTKLRAVGDLWKKLNSEVLGDLDKTVQINRAIRVKTRVKHKN